MAQKAVPPVEALRNTLTTLANDLLDAFYSEVPHANAYGTDYDADEEFDGTWYLGREYGADGAEDELGVDFFYRKFSPEPVDPRRRGVHNEYENEYVYGNYGWMDVNQLLDERDRLRQLFEGAVEDGFLDDDALDDFSEAFDETEATMQKWRQSFSLADIESLFRNYEKDTLFDLLAHDDEESRVVWSLLFSKDEDRNVVENPLDVSVVSEENAFMFVRAERTFVEDDGTTKQYPYGAVIGYDDTPDTFFVHRIESDSDLKDPETEWTPELLKQKMGFDLHLWEVDNCELPYEQIVRCQGDLAVVRHDYRDALWEYYESILERKRQSIAREHFQAFIEANPEYETHSGIVARAYSTQFSFRVNERAIDGTEDLKEIQEDFNIEEETVRERMRPDWQQLSAKRRRQLIDEILQARLETWAVAECDTSAAELADEAETEAREEFESTRRQVNAVYGNHTVVLGPATEHPNRTWGDEDTLGAIIVLPEAEANGFIVHDEHDDKQLTMGSGIYEFRFLQGYEDPWWLGQ